MLAVLLLNPTDRGGNLLNILKVASAYGKDTNPQGLIDNSKILYVEPNKKRTQNWLTVNRLQLPLPSSSYGFINTIVANKPSGVNIHSMQKGQKNAQNGGSNTHHSLEVDRQGNALSEAQEVPVPDDFFNALDNAIGNRQRMLDGEQRNTTDDKSSTGIRFSKDLDQYPYDMQTVIKEYLFSKK